MKNAAKNEPNCPVRESYSLKKLTTRSQHTADNSKWDTVNRKVKSRNSLVTD